VGHDNNCPETNLEGRSKDQKCLHLQVGAGGQKLVRHEYCLGTPKKQRERGISDDEIYVVLINLGIK
jgi:hypothetical protein